MPCLLIHNITSAGVLFIICSESINMWHLLWYFVTVILLQVVVGCDRKGFPPCEHKTHSCTTQILDNHSDAESCKVEYFDANSEKCKSMQFGPISSNAGIGGVSLQPYILPYTYDCNGTLYSLNYTVLNISFSNIKWKKMQFRFKPINKDENHCRNIVISHDVTVNDKSVLYYNCYWQATVEYNGQSHYFDFEASDGKDVNRGRFIFDVPTPLMLNSHTSEEYWRPFVYIEVLADKMKLHIMPPPKNLRILEYKISIMKERKIKPDETISNTTIKDQNITTEVVYEWDIIRSTGLYYFKVTAIHDKCVNGEIECQVLKTPIIPINLEVQPLQYCIASIVALIVSVLFVFYAILRAARRYWCKDYGTLPKYPEPPSILLIYSPSNYVHAQVVNAFVKFLRSDYGLPVMYDEDIASTSHMDPMLWAYEAFEKATHVIYVIGPKPDYLDRPIPTPHKNVDQLILQQLRAKKANNPRWNIDVCNVSFDYSNGEIPIETKYAKTFKLLKDLHKMIEHLTKGALGKKRSVNSELLNALNQANSLLINGLHKDHIIIRSEKMVEKVLL